MQSRWNDADARKAVRTYARSGVAKDLALRTYTTRLLGSDPLLVLHGGGNTSVKTGMADLLGETHEVLCVKGSGWDMGTIEPAGLPAVKLKPLRRLRGLDKLADEDMVNFQRVNLLDARAPNPSVETLLHAFLPHKFIDHTHAAAVLSLVDQPDGEELVAEVYDGAMGLVPYAIPGFGLAKLAAQVYDAKPDVEGLILHKHGIFTFGADAREAYERMIAHVSRAEARLRKGRRNVFAAAALPKAVASAAEVAPVLRGAVAVQPAAGRRGAHAVHPRLPHQCGHPQLRRRRRSRRLCPARRGDARPHHPDQEPPADRADARGGQARRLRRGGADGGGGLREALRCHVRAPERPRRRHQDQARREPARGAGARPRPLRHRRHGQGCGHRRRPRRRTPSASSPMPRPSAATSRWARPTCSNVEYWSLEQAKLKGAVAKAFTGQVALVTGAGSGIGLATAQAFAAQGAAVAVLDRDAKAATAAAKALGGLGLDCDVTDRAQVHGAFERIAQAFGGVDIVVSNAGAAWQGRIGEVSDAVLRASFELNFFAHQAVAQAAVHVMLRQGTGGVLLFNVSKQAVSPGPDFGPYGLPKAATLALMRQYALDYGAAGIRANGVNADRIRSGLLTDAMVASRAKARGVSEAEYMGGNLLKREVTAADVAQAFVALAKARSTTGHIETVDGGNIAAALR